MSAALPTGEEWGIILLTLRTAAAASLLLLPPGILCAWLLARPRWPGKTFVETIVMLPLVLPPVATGLVLLRLFGRRGSAGRAIASVFGVDVVFTWRAVVLAMMVMAMPLLVRSARTAFEDVPGRLEDVARTLGASEWRVFYTVTLPLAARGVAAGLLLAFARSLGEFGATVLVAGNIPGRTRTISLAIYNSVELGSDRPALRLVAVATVMAFALLLAAERFSRRARAR